jgi:hypothetical protein
VRLLHPITRLALILYQNLTLCIKSLAIQIRVVLCFADAASFGALLPAAPSLYILEDRPHMGAHII